MCDLNPPKWIRSLSSGPRGCPIDAMRIKNWCLTISTLINDETDRTHHMMWHKPHPPEVLEPREAARPCSRFRCQTAWMWTRETLDVDAGNARTVTEPKSRSETRTGPIHVIKRIVETARSCIPSVRFRFATPHYRRPRPLWDRWRPLNYWSSVCWHKQTFSFDNIICKISRTVVYHQNRLIINIVSDIKLTYSVIMWTYTLDRVHRKAELRDIQWKRRIVKPRPFARFTGSAQLDFWFNDRQVCVRINT